MHSPLQNMFQAAVRNLGIKSPDALAQNPGGMTPVPELLPMHITHEPHTGPGFVQKELSQEKCISAKKAGVSCSLSAISSWKQALQPS